MEKNPVGQTHGINRNILNLSDESIERFVLLNSLNLESTWRSVALTAKESLVDANERIRELEETVSKLRFQLIQLSEEAMVDKKTGLLNLEAFRAVFDHTTSDTTRKSNAGKQHTLVFFDVDNFGTLNSSMTHALVDQYILKPLGETITANIRDETDIAARYGGDEFTILMLDTTAADAQFVMERLQDSLLFPAGPDSDDSQIRLSLSIGFAEFTQGTPFDEVLLNANKAETVEKSRRKNIDQ